jgi:predicted permease
MSWWSRLGNVFRPTRVEREVDAELRFHLDERVRDLMADGRPREEAERAATRRLGSPLRLREQSLDVKRLAWLDAVVRDVRLGARMLRRNPVVMGAAVVSLSLALGACVAAFSLVEALIFRKLPVPQPDALIYLSFATDDPDRPEADTFSDPTFVRLREAARGRVDLFAMSTQVIRPVTFDADTRERARTQYVSGDAFAVLGVGPAAGRLFTVDDDRQPGAHPVAVVSHAYWMRRFGGDPAIVGRWFQLEERQFQIVGVTGPRFTGVEPGRPTDLWFPYAMYNPRAFGNFSFNWFRIFGRMADNVRIEQAQGVLQSTFTSVRRERAPAFASEQSPEKLARVINAPLYLRSAATGPSPLRRQFERSLWILAAIAGLVLLIAGSNVATLFLARAAAREHEMALRLSIGAGRGRLIQQLLAESAVVAVLACALGLLFATIAAPGVVSLLASADEPVQLDLRAGWRILAFVAGLAVGTTVLFGLAPALRASSVAPMTPLKSGGGRSSTRMGALRPFVAIQVAFGLTVLFVGGLLLLSFIRLSRVELGFASADVLLVSMEPAQRVEPGRQRAALFETLDRLGRLPGVQAVSSAEYGVLGRPWTVFARVPASGREPIETTATPVTHGFFETMRIPLLAGRTFDRHDMDTPDPNAIIVNETFGRRYYGDDRPVGRTYEGGFGTQARQYEVVGVVADAKYDVRQPAAPTIYLPVRTGGTIHVRVAGDPGPFASRLRDEIRAANPLVRVTSVQRQSTAVTQTLLRERLLALLAGFFGAVGLVLVAVGLYGVLSYSVEQRTREIGVRVALGARPIGVVRAILADAAGPTLVGAACGMAGGLYLSRFVQALLFEITPLDGWSLALPLATLLLTSVAATAVPAVRAARVDPVIALRYE